MLGNRIARTPPDIRIIINKINVLARFCVAYICRNYYYRIY
jgi:hypothetical protein